MKTQERKNTSQAELPPTWLLRSLELVKPELEKLKQLKKISLRETKTTAAGLKKLQEALPETEINLKPPVPLPIPPKGR